VPCILHFSPFLSSHFSYFPQNRLGLCPLPPCSSGYFLVYTHLVNNISQLNKYGTHQWQQSPDLPLWTILNSPSYLKQRPHEHQSLKPRTNSICCSSTPYQCLAPSRRTIPVKNLVSVPVPIISKIQQHNSIQDHMCSVSVGIADPKLFQSHHDPTLTGCFDLFQVLKKYSCKLK
jgi:hypothetical protein